MFSTKVRVGICGECGEKFQTTHRNKTLCDKYSCKMARRYKNYKSAKEKAILRSKNSQRDNILSTTSISPG